MYRVMYCTCIIHSMFVSDSIHVVLTPTLFCLIIIESKLDMHDHDFCSVFVSDSSYITLTTTFVESTLDTFPSADHIIL